MKNPIVFSAEGTPDEIIQKFKSMEGSLYNEDVSRGGQMASSVRINRVCLRKLSDYELEFSENFGLGGIYEVYGKCKVHSIDKGHSEIALYFYNTGASATNTYIRKSLMFLVAGILLFGVTLLLVHFKLGDDWKTALIPAAVVGGIPVLATISRFFFLFMTNWQIRFFKKKFMTAAGATDKQY